MKTEYDFSKGERGKFYRKDAELNIPVYLEKDVAEFIKDFAKKKKTDTQSIVNLILRNNKDIIRSWQ